MPNNRSINIKNACQKCGAEVLWLTHKTSGKAAPIEAAPNVKGNILVKDGQYRIAGADEIEKARKIGHPLFLNHFSSCEFAEHFRKGKKK